MDWDELRDVLGHRPTLEVLDGGALTPRDLVERLDVSRSTVHRLADDLVDGGLVERTNGELALTSLGAAVLDGIQAFEHHVTAARRLEPALGVFANREHDFPLGAFADATVTESAPSEPYRPVKRFMELVAETDTLRGLDPATINPLHLDDLHGAILDGMETDAVFRPDVVRELLDNNTERARTALESGNLTLRTHDDLTFGLSLFDDRVGVGVYDDETGVLDLYADTDSQAAYAWGEDVYESVREDAAVVDLAAELSTD